MIYCGEDFVYNYGYHFLNTGTRYDPDSDSWTATTTTNAPDGRESQTAVWTGSDMIVWGGYFDIPNNRIFLNTGGLYRPAANSWIATNITNAPSARAEHTAVWTGSEMIVWGGYFEDNGFQELNTGGLSDPSTDRGTATTTVNGPSEWRRQQALRTGE